LKFRREYLILAVVIAALCVYLFTRQSDRTLYELPRLPEVSGSAVTKIEIEKPSGTIVLEKADESWFIGDRKYPAAKNKVTQMVDTIEDLTLTALIAESGDYVRYDLTDEKKISVKAYAGDRPVREFDIGKTGPSFRHTFVKLAGDPQVYNARDNFRNKFDRTVEELRDKYVLNFASSDIERIELIQGEERLILTRQEAPLEQPQATQAQEGEKPSAIKSEMIWQTAGGRRADAAAVDRLLSTMAQLECEKYITDRTKKDFSDPIYRIQLKGPQEFSLSIFAKQTDNAEQYPAVSSQNDYPFFLPDWRGDSLMPEFDELVTAEDGK
jgi:hypothetical protein